MPRNARCVSLTQQQLLLHIPTLLLLLSSLFTLLPVNLALRPAKVLEYNNYSLNPFEGTVLDEIVNFRIYRGDHYKVYPEGSRERQMALHQPRIFSMFDWVIGAHWFHDGDFAGDLSKDPRSVLVLAGRKNFMSDIPPLRPGQKRVLVMGGEDHRLSNNLANPLGCRAPVSSATLISSDSNSKDGDAAEVTELAFTRFTSVFFEAKDVPHPRVWAPPMGFIDMYIHKAGVHFVTDVVRAARSGVKSELAFAAWGREWKKLDNSISDRVELAQFLSQPQQELWIKRQMLDHRSYWKALSASKFSLCPAGNGIQSPKLFEAMTVRAVPVVTPNPAFEDLVRLGFPMLIVPRWEVLSAQFLQQQYERVYQYVDWDVTYKMMTRQGFFELLLNGTHYPFNPPLPSHLLKLQQQLR